MNLKQLFGSGARTKLLAHLYQSSRDQFFIRELTRILDEQINSLRRELMNLEDLGIVRSKHVANRKYYTVNEDFTFHNELKSIFLKNQDRNGILFKKIQKLPGNTDLILLTGAFILQDADFDMFVVGDIREEYLQELLDEIIKTKEFRDDFQTPIRFAIMSKKDFLYRLTLNDNFIREILENPDNFLLKNKMKRDIRKFISSEQ
jgi:DNA-binding transcriptional ArsR family regulator